MEFRRAHWLRSRWHCSRSATANPTLANIKGVLADALRLSTALPGHHGVQSRLEAVHARRADLVIKQRVLQHACQIYRTARPRLRLCENDRPRHLRRCFERNPATEVPDEYMCSASVLLSPSGWLCTSEPRSVAPANTELRIRWLAAVQSAGTPPNVARIKLEPIVSWVGELPATSCSRIQSAPTSSAASVRRASESSSSAMAAGSRLFAAGPPPSPKCGSTVFYWCDPENSEALARLHWRLWRDPAPETTIHSSGKQGRGGVRNDPRSLSSCTRLSGRPKGVHHMKRAPHCLSYKSTIVMLIWTCTRRFFWQGGQSVYRRAGCYARIGAIVRQFGRKPGSGALLRLRRYAPRTYPSVQPGTGADSGLNSWFSMR